MGDEQTNRITWQHMQQAGENVGDTPSLGGHARHLEGQNEHLSIEVQYLEKK